MSRCNGKTKNNQRCKRKINHKSTSKYCFIHTYTDGDCDIQCTKNQTIDCPVCMELVDKINDTELECNHPICIDCAKKLHDNKCPICRAQLSSKKLKSEDIKIIEERRQLETYNQNEELLIELLRTQTRHEIFIQNHRNTTRPPAINRNLSSLSPLSSSHYNVIQLDRLSMELIII